MMCVRYSHDGRFLAAGYADGYIRVRTSFFFILLDTAKHSVACIYRMVLSLYVAE